MQASEPDPQDVRQTLYQLRGGDSAAVERLMNAVYGPLRALASAYFRTQPPGHTLQPTALVHEVFMKVVDQRDAEWKDRAHFLAVCARAMRGVLVDHARAKGSIKRGGAERERVPLDSALALTAEDEVDLLDLEEHLVLLATLNDRQARIVECRCFSGMTIPELAEALGVAPRTIDADWAMARAWLSARLADVR
jgi:RNA polymerase sigma factor (TIGR02999 family)